MANELTPKWPTGHTLSLSVRALSGREYNSREINEQYGEGGALNANYQTIDAALVAISALAENGILYGADVHFKTGGWNTVLFEFRTEEIRGRAMRVLNAERQVSEAA